MSGVIEREPTLADKSVGEVYERRFTDSDSVKKHALWREICRYLQRYVDARSTVLDLACDRGYFIENITAAERWATDIRDVSQHLSSTVRFAQADGLEIDHVLPKDTFDIVFTSNYLEHLSSPDQVIDQLRAVTHVLRPGGTVIVLQPNIRLVGGAYWDFIDHKVALTEHSLAEAAEIAGLRTTRVITRFLPYTTKSRLPQHPLAARLYLAFRPAWLVLGKQTLYFGQRPQ
jgi:2-polyprenyl-3-methyl-5-hydroxy-6-metoxy-1,4-benzoquinol methylase